MRFSTLFMGTSALLLLSHCATKHQPVEFEPYFALRPEGALTSEQWLETKSLESRPVSTLSDLEKKRLMDLYTMELRLLKAGTPRQLQLSEAISKLRVEVGYLEKEVAQIQQELRSSLAEAPTDRPPAVFQSIGTKREYGEALQLWNKNQGPAALKKIDDLLRPNNSLSKAERLRILNLRFRVMLEENNLPGAGQAYLDMQKIENCDPDTAQAGFLYALHVFSEGDGKKASAIFQAQCDSDVSSANLVRRKYWQARFQEQTPEISTPLYEELSRAAVPGYHSFFAQVRLGRKITLPQNMGTRRLYLEEEFKVPSEVDRCLTAAEARLKVHLRKDAGVYLVKASRLMKKKPEKYFLGLLYTAHLFHAAGNHLEAMKIYTELNNSLLEGKSTADVVTSPVYAEMFPRPLAGKVDWVARLWALDPDFVYSIIRQESAFNPGAVSLADARGLMQLMPSLAKTLSKQWNFQFYYSDRGLFSAEENLKLGVFHLHQLHELVPHLALIAASYNAGVNRALNWWKRHGSVPLDVFVELIPITETRNYVKLVLRNYFFYKALRNNGVADPGLVPFQLGRFPGEYADIEPEDSLSSLLLNRLTKADEKIEVD